MNHLANVGPLSIAVDASRWSSYSHGVFSGCDYDRNIEINHGKKTSNIFSTFLEFSLESFLFHNNFIPFQPFNWLVMVLMRRKVTTGLSVTVGANSGVKMDSWDWREKPTLHVVLIALLLWVLVVLMMAMMYSPSAVNVVSYLMCVTQLVSLMSRALKKGNISLAYSAKCCTCLWWLNKGVPVLLLSLFLTLSY